MDDPSTDESQRPTSNLPGFLLWPVAVLSGILASGFAYLVIGGVFGETAGHVAGVIALISAAAAWVLWGPELPDIPD